MGQFDTVEPLEESTTSLVSSSTSAYSSFPVDVVVYVRVQVFVLLPAYCAATRVAFFHTTGRSGLYGLSNLSND